MTIVRLRMVDETMQTKMVDTYSQREEEALASPNGAPTAFSGNPVPDELPDLAT
jgi:hypothetical protein